VPKEEVAILLHSLLKLRLVEDRIVGLTKLFEIVFRPAFTGVGCRHHGAFWPIGEGAE
jgi:hypothetical protein